MKLTDEQIKYIENYIKSVDIKYYEVYMEILDHMILSVEAILLEKKTISFDDAVVQAKVEGFGEKGFRGMMSERIKLLNISYRKSYNNSIKNYFKMPQIITILIVFGICFGFISFFNKPIAISVIMMVVPIGYVLIDWIVKVRKYGRKDTLKVLKMTVFGYYSNAVFMWLYFSNFLVSFASDYLGDSIFLKLLASFMFTMCFISFLIYLRISKETIYEIETQIFV